MDSQMAAILIQSAVPVCDSSHYIISENVPRRNRPRPRALRKSAASSTQNQRVSL